MNHRVLIAMSGGVDSSVAAFLLKEKGDDCIGVTMKLFQNEAACIPHEKSCCSLTDVEDARNIANSLDIPYYVFNFTDAFQKQVIDRFIHDYENEATPNPCIDCNRYMKFEKLYQRAILLDCTSVATGHYARIERENGRFLLKKGLDLDKDQSYVLYFMTQEQLAHTQFPLGELKKEQIRKIANEHGFANAHKRESQDICFVPDGDYAKVIEHHTGKSYLHGHFVDRNGSVLGEHEGMIRYTIGQRKGIGLSCNERMYVLEKRSRDNTVVLGKHEDLFSKELYASNVNWIAFKEPPRSLRVKAKIRYRQKEEWATVTPCSENSIHVTFDQPQRAITKGQAVVLYDGDVVIGGGTII